MNRIFTLFLGLCLVISTAFADTTPKPATTNATATPVPDGSTTVKPDKKHLTCYEGNSTEQIIFGLNSFKVKLPESKESVEFKEAQIATSCQIETKDQVVKLSLGVNESLQFDFAFSNPQDNATYVLTQITYKESGNLWQATSLNLNAPDGNKFKSGLQGYTCDSLKFSLTKNGGNQTASLELSTLEFVAFPVEGKTATRIECKDESGSTVIPLAVGGGLCVFMAIALVIYIVIRQRSK